MLPKPTAHGQNSPRDIQDNYLELATQEEADEWFSIEPTADRLKELQKYAEELKKRVNLDEI